MHQQTLLKARSSRIATPPVHIEVDSRTKRIHSVAATAANVHDRQVLPELT